MSADNAGIETPVDTPKGRTDNKTIVRVLLLVRDAVFVSQRQVLALRTQYAVQPEGKVLEQSLRRYVALGYLRQHKGDGRYAKVVYSITQKGLSVLEYEGYALCSVSSESAQVVDEAQMLHFLGLAEVRIALTGSFTQWAPDVQLKSLRMLGEVEFCKDYDAVVDVVLGSQTTRIALEYELTAKSTQRYIEIAERLQKERHVGLVLYVTQSDQMIRLLLKYMGANPLICCTRSSSLIAKGLDAGVFRVSGNEIRQESLRSLLRARVAFAQQSAGGPRP